MKIPPRFQEADYNKISPNIRKIVDEMKENRKGLYLWGDCGTGKTFTAYSIHKGMHEAEIYSKVISFTELLRDIKSGFNADSGYVPTDHLGEILNYDSLLIIDDIGAEKTSEWVRETIYLIVNKYYEEMRPIIFTSNYNLDQLAARVGERIASRITEMCHIVQLTGQDKRLK